MSNEALLSYQAGQRQKTIEAIERAKRAIEQEIRQHGYYPGNGGRLSKLEVLRRAGISPQTLKNRTHKKTTSSLDRWMKGMKKTAPTLRPEAEGIKKSKIDALTAKLQSLAAHYDLFKLEYNELLHRCETLEEENADLRERLAGGTGANVVPLIPKH